MFAMPMQGLVRGICLGAVLSMSAFAEVQITVSITGTPEEMLPILERLRGVGAAAGQQLDSLKLEVQSNAAAPPPPAPAPPAPAPQPVPAPAPAPGAPGVELKDAQATPSSVAQGDSFMVSVVVVDPSHSVETVECVVLEQGSKFDLYDDATHGDAQAGDGIWSNSFKAEGAPGTYTLEISPYDSSGAFVVNPANPDATQALRTRATFNISGK